MIAAALADAGMQPSHLAGLEMHGTGTPLGDPIEVGAVAAVLSDSRRPLQLSAAKSLTGHAEPAAGTAGLVQAANLIAQRRAAVLPHIRSVNPHVASLLEGSARGTLAVARAAGGRVTNGANAAVGASAFAFQGTNAHAILNQAAAAVSLDLSQGPEAVWQRQRYWFAAQPRALLHTAGARQGVAVFQTHLSRAALAFMLEHRVGGKPLMPGAAMFDLSCSAGMCLLPSGRVALEGAKIAAPLVLDDPSVETLSCSVSTADGRVEIRSGSAQHGAERMHLTAHLRELSPFLSPLCIEALITAVCNGVPCL